MINKEYLVVDAEARANLLAEVELYELYQRPWEIGFRVAVTSGFPHKSRVALGLQGQHDSHRPSGVSRSGPRIRADCTYGRWRGINN